MEQVATAGKLLIVDDSKVSRMRIRAFFSAQCPAWDIQEAGTGDEAIALASTFRPDYVTMDVNMPGMSGFEAADLLLMYNPAVRVVINEYVEIAHAFYDKGEPSFINSVLDRVARQARPSDRK